MNKNLSLLIGDTILAAIKHGYDVQLLQTETVDDCGGYVDEDNKVFAVAVGKPVADWATVFIHESCHLDQLDVLNSLWHTPAARKDIWTSES